MDQKTNVQNRAEKEYKNSREKFYLLLREVLSNALHAVIIREKKEKDFTPVIDFEVTLDEDKCIITIKDNGEGFTENNRRYFEALDTRNVEKVKYNFHPLGQGRLAIVHFSDSASYETIYKDTDNNYWKRTIPYPSKGEGLFDIEKFNKETTLLMDTYTRLTLILDQQNTLSRAKTFFKKHKDKNELKLWVIETFFPYFVQNQKLQINLSFNGDCTSIKKDSLDSEIKKLPFNISFDDGTNSDFTLWLIKKNQSMKGENPIICFARNLKADLVYGKLSYTIDNPSGYTLYLTSDLFDDQVDTKGDKIEISNSEISEIQQSINNILDEEFSDVIINNKKESKRNLAVFRKRYPSLEVFIDKNAIGNENNIVTESDILKRAVDEKSRIEKKFWTHIGDESTNDNQERFDESEDCRKLLNSSLHIYVRHRKSVLQQLHALLPKFNEDGELKPELEKTVHELFFRRGTTLKSSENINHLHNLWIIDDKFTTFSNDFQAVSTKSGQSLSDIYIWADDPEKTKQVLIIELKSTTKAHNAGDKHEGMIAQVRRYAKAFHKEPEKTINWSVNTDNVQYTAVILARKTDIEKELTSDSVTGTYNSIPFLANSYYLDDEFTTNGPKDKKAIRIELYSFEDIYYLASSRNEVFFKLLQREFKIDDEA